MNRKLYLLGLLLLFFHASFAQRTFVDTFSTAEGEKISIEVIDYAKFGISNAFVIVANDETEYSQLKKEIKSCPSFQKNKSRIFLSCIPSEKFDSNTYLALVEHILSSYKLLDSRLFLIDEGQATQAYVEKAERNQIKKAVAILNQEDIKTNFCGEIDRQLR